MKMLPEKCALVWWIFVGLVLGFVCAELDFNNDLENSQKFQSIPTTVKTFENDTVLLPCTLNTPFRYVRWHRDDVALVDSRHPEILPPDRIMLWPNGSLQVANVQSEDTGDYYCEMNSDSGHVVQQHAIEVQLAPRVLIEPSGLTELPLGATFEVVCEAQGVPQPVVDWRRNGHSLGQGASTGNRQSHITEIKSRSQSGLIECFASNGVGEPAVAGVYLHVLFSPEVNLPQSVVYTKLGTRAHLECIVEAAPAATVKWFHHGLPVPLGTHYSSHETELQSNRSLEHYVNGVRHMLVIKNVRNADMGQFECRASNRIGARIASIELTGRPMPCIFKINPGTQSSTSHVLVWQTESLLPIMEFKLKFRQIPSNNITRQIRTNWTELTIPAQATNGLIYITTYTLHGLQPASLYEVSVLARNSFGWSDSSKTVRFATGGEVELPNYSTESELQNDVTEEQDFLNEITQRSDTLRASMMFNSGSAAEGRGLSRALIYSICLLLVLTYQ
ncbi:neurotrimin [Drosophila guanche]|uniref:Blast:Opioid-binding protein/cell adhesion molecule n=1 Tax=Drosophila guanche TaxID=7266 RepID=A0A3B0J206_DROGU|nr:neurotrimin [Drosophila guanche]SPP75075.1 blast:Opioid-binding protein/cell adhesion molecule [Drosophila guanche]